MDVKDFSFASIMPPVTRVKPLREKGIAKSPVNEGSMGSREFYDILIGNMLDAMIIIDWKGVILLGNKAAAQLMDLKTPEEGIGANFSEFLWEDSQEIAWRDIGHLKRDRNEFYNHYMIKTKTGEIKWVEGLSRKVRFGRKSVVALVLRDISERKWIEEKILEKVEQLRETKDLLVQSEKLAAIGRISAGVAHEILNPLNIMSMRLQLMEARDGIPDSIRGDFAILKSQISRIVKITKDLNEFARTSTNYRTLNDIHKVIDGTISMTEPLLKIEKVTLEVSYGMDLPDIVCDKYRIEQVIFNIICNAVDAMRGKKDKFIAVNTDSVNDDEDNRYVRITIADKGPGMKPTDLAKIFEPFFTTKPQGKGTGLGLFIAYKIIQDHAGRMRAENNEWGGLSFIIDLPVTIAK
ncbi:MAG: ATP-binding protein [Smithellaceae bacterium]|nr:ATP-binding protein [Smithellaceae bacterium]